MADEPLASQAHENHSIAGRLIGALPAPYLALALVNIVTIGGFFYYEDRLAERRSAITNRVVDVCISRGGELADLGKDISAVRALLANLQEREGRLENQMVGLTTKLDLIDEASRAELRGARKTAR